MWFPIGNRKKAIQYALLWTVYALLHALSLMWIVELPFELLLVDAAVHAVLFALLGLVLWNVVLYGNYNDMPLVQRYINYGALGLLSVSLWLGLGYGANYLLLNVEQVRVFIPFLPLYAFIGLMLYVLVLLHFQNKMFEIESLKDERKLEQTIEEAEVEQPVIEQLESDILERVAVKSGQKIHVILVPDILYLQADGDYVHIFTLGGKYLKEQTMKYFEDNLPISQFVRVHRSYIVNIEAISRIELYEKQSQLLTIKNGDRIKVSAGGYKLLKNKLGL